MELILLRHSTTQGNLERRYVGSQDHPLVQQGLDLASEKASSMPSIERLWRSPMLRCRQTAEILFPEMVGEVVAGLRECSFGSFEGRTWAELQKHPIYQAWVSGDPSASFPGGDLLGEHIAHSCQATRDIIAQAKQDGLSRIGIVAHGGTLMAVMSEMALPHKAYYEWLPNNCGGYRVSVDTESGQLTLINEI